MNLVNLFTLILNIGCFGKTLGNDSLIAMTYNIRYNNPGDNINSWPNRKEKLMHLIKKHNPDIIFFQEVLYDQLTYLKSELLEYEYVGTGRNGGKKGEFSPVFYKKNRFKWVKSETIWLNEKLKPKEKGWDASLPRIFTYAELKIQWNKKEQTILAISTHFDHKGEIARIESAKTILNFVKKYLNVKPHLPVIIGGDFNFTDQSKAYQFLEEGETVFDSFKHAKVVNGEGTGCGFNVGGKICNRIDYILYSGFFYAKSHFVDQTNDGQYYPSDHLPVIVKLGSNNP